MKKIFLLIIIFVSVLNKSEAQQISIHTDKESYDSKDSIEISLSNNSFLELVYVIALESNIDNKWVGMESDITMMGMKSERLRTIKKNQILKRKIILPEYIVKIVIRNDCKVRFRLKSGIDYDKGSIIYTNAIKISLPGGRNKLPSGVSL